MSVYTTIIEIPSEDLVKLKKTGYSLYVFKAYEAPTHVFPTVWFKLQESDLYTTTQIYWEDKYQGFNSKQHVRYNEVINEFRSIPVDLGNLISIGGSYGDLEITTDAVEDSISFLNGDHRPYAVGVNQKVYGKFKPVCTLSYLSENSAAIIKPIAKIGLVFANRKIETGTVITRAFSSGCIIDFEEVYSRKVKISFENGWEAPRSAKWLTTFEEYTNLSKLLNLSSFNKKRNLVNNLE